MAIENGNTEKANTLDLNPKRATKPTEMSAEEKDVLAADLFRRIRGMDQAGKQVMVFIIHKLLEKDVEVTEMLEAGATDQLIRYAHNFISLAVKWRDEQSAAGTEARHA